MTELLVRWFVKDPTDVENSAVRTKYGVLGSGVGIVCNVLLFVFKLILGLMAQSVSVMADAFNNLSDAASSLISYVGVRMASKPADEEHPFGHGRMEYIAAFIVAFLVLEVGMSFFKDAFDKILHPQSLTVKWGVIAGLVLTILIKFWLGMFYKKLGKRISSNVLEAAGTDSFGDVFGTLASIVSIVVYGLWDINIDGYIGLLVACLIILAGIGIIRDTMEPLIGQAVEPEVYYQIENFVKKYEGIEDTHDLIVHNYGPTRRMASIHAEVRREQDVMVSHEIIDTIERDAVKELGIFLVIHMDPVEMDSDEVVLARTRVKTILENLDERLSIHDFRLVNGENQVNLIFDMVVPFDYNEEKNKDIKKRLENILRVEDPRYRCVITFDKSFMGKAEE